MSELAHVPVQKIAQAEFSLTVEDAEVLKAQAASYRAAAAGGGDPMWRAETIARAVALEEIAKQVSEGIGVLQRGNGREVIVRVPLDAPWKQQEVAHASSDAPSLVNAEASVARLTLARDADALSLAVDAAERHGANTPAEQMLAHQMAASHQLAMKLMAKSRAFLAREFLAYKNPFGDGGEAAREQAASIEAGRLATAAARVMEATARIAVVLDRLKNGSTQTIVVQQKVDIESGGQALVNGAVVVSPRRLKKKRKE